MPSKTSLTPTQIQALALVFEGELTSTQIAEQLGIDRRTLLRWQSHPVWIQTMAEWNKEVLESLRQESIAGKRQRVNVCVERHEALKKIIEARRKQYAGTGDAELESGYYKPQKVRYIRSDGTVKTVVRNVLDRRLVQTMMADENQISRMLDAPMPPMAESPRHSATQQNSQLTCTLFGGGVSLLGQYVMQVLGDPDEIMMTLIKCGRLPKTPEAVEDFLRELSERAKAKRLGLPLPSWEEPYHLDQENNTALSPRGDNDEI